MRMLVDLRETYWILSIAGITLAVWIVALAVEHDFMRYSALQRRVKMGYLLAKQNADETWRMVCGELCHKLRSKCNGAFG